MRPLLAAAVGFLVQQASAHGGAANYTVGDIWYPGYDPYAGDWQDHDPTIPQRKWITNEPIFQTTNLSLACNFPGTPARASIPVPAGSNFSAIYNTWLHTIGPMIAWMTHCTNDDCSSFDPVASNADWFKIGEKGLLEGDILTGMWFQKEFSRWDGSPSIWTETVPETLRPGGYLIRHEIVSLHSEFKPQWYPECVQVRVTGQGKSYPGKEYMAKIPGVWSMDQPEINMNPYDPKTGSKTEYKIPGPPIWTG